MFSKPEGGGVFFGRADVPVPGLRVERVPHVVFFVRDPDVQKADSETTSSLAAIGAARVNTTEQFATDPFNASWNVGTGLRRKRVFRFSHAEPDIITYGEAFLLKHASCKTIDLENHLDCNSAKNEEDL